MIDLWWKVMGWFGAVLIALLGWMVIIKLSKWFWGWL